VGEKLLDIRNLCVEYRTKGGVMHAITDISFDLEEGEILGVVGESGCGKSSLGHAIMRLLPRDGKISKGEVKFKGKDLLQYSEEKMDKQIRGKQISMIFQDPQNCLNPVFTIETQLTDIMRFHLQHKKNIRKERRSLRDKAIKLLKETGIGDPEERISDYPFQFSGGMKQRVMIAMALTSKTCLLICDEPTTGLDATIEAQIIELIKNLAKKYKYSILYITHNLAVIAEISDRMMIMYTGRIVEMADSRSIFEYPRHPYTMAMLDSLPGGKFPKRRLPTIPGHVPPLYMLPQGCPFHPRCSFSKDICKKSTPKLTEVTSGHWVACLRLDELEGKAKCYY
jgi:oligopeptide/dipeptide ABC transporter ATP-binding protein